MLRSPRTLLVKDFQQRYHPIAVTPARTALDPEVYPPLGFPNVPLLTPHLCLIIKNNWYQVPNPNVWPIRRNEIKLDVLRSLQTVYEPWDGLYFPGNLTIPAISGSH